MAKPQNPAPLFKRIDHRDSNDPALNLALEEYCVRHLPPTEYYVLAYTNTPCVVVGKNQNCIAEVNLDWIDQTGLPIYRRASGGGTVFHGAGNLCFSYHLPFRQGRILDFKDFVSPIVSALVAMGVEAESRARQDIFIGDKKISGTAQFFAAKRMFHHGTLLFDADLSQLKTSLAVDRTGIQSKASPSVRSPVTNITEHLELPMSYEEFTGRIVQAIAGAEPELYSLTAEQWQTVEDLAESRYRSWDWNIGQSPPFTISRSQNYNNKTVQLTLKVRKGTIREIETTLPQALDQVAKKLIGCRYHREDIQSQLGSAADALLPMIY